MGIVINRPLELGITEVFDHLSIEYDQHTQFDANVMMGGPVETQCGFVIHDPLPEQRWEAVIQVSGGLSIATSRDILVAMAAGHGPKRALVALGYAGWGAGQLESEVLDNAWLSGPASTAVVFDCPHAQRWRKAAELMGVDVDRLSTMAGHS